MSNSARKLVPPSAVGAAFRIAKGPLKGRKYEFETNIVTMGRSPDANICFAEDRTVSWIHAEIHLVDGHYVLENRSDTGTAVNGKLVEKKQLESGDSILIGEEHLIDFTEVIRDKDVGSRPLKSKKLLIGGGLYLAALAAVAVFLSQSQSTLHDAGAEQLQKTESQYADYASKSNLPKEEQNARVRLASSYMRAALIAKREGRYDDAVQIYLRLLEFAQDHDNPIYQYAITQLRRIPETR